MKYLRRLASTAMLLTCVAGTAAAQSDTSSSARPAEQLPSVDVSGDRIQVLQRWTKEYNEWRAWFAEWKNRREPGLLSAKQRKLPPVPPAWLPDACALLGDEKGAIAEGCAAYRDWARNDYATEIVAQQIAQTRADAEKTRKTIWWEHVHVDALWPMTQTGSNAYGVAGMHTTLQVSRRFQIFLAPGVMMMRVPNGDGTERWSPATHWGFSYRLLDFVLPGTHRPSRLHLNIARVWLLGGNRLPAAGEMYLAGFSLTFRDRGDEPGPDHTGDPASSSAQRVR